MNILVRTAAGIHKWSDADGDDATIAYDATGLEVISHGEKTVFPMANVLSFSTSGSPS